MKPNASVFRKRLLILAITLSPASLAGAAEVSTNAQPRCAAEAVSEQIALEERKQDTADVDWQAPPPATDTSCSVEITKALDKLQVPPSVFGNYLSGIVDINKLVSGFQDKLCERAESYIDDAWKKAQDRAGSMGGRAGKLAGIAIDRAGKYTDTLDLGSLRLPTAPTETPITSDGFNYVPPNSSSGRPGDKTSPRTPPTQTRPGNNPLL